MIRPRDATKDKECGILSDMYRNQPDPNEFYGQQDYSGNQDADHPHEGIEQFQLPRDFHVSTSYSSSNCTRQPHVSQKAGSSFTITRYQKTRLIKSFRPQFGQIYSLAFRFAPAHQMATPASIHPAPANTPMSMSTMLHNTTVANAIQKSACPPNSMAL